MLYARKRQTGFSLLESVFVLLILALLANMSYPVFRDEMEKARLSELSLRIDAMRSAFKTAYEQGDRSMFDFKLAQPGQIPAELASLPVKDSLHYPNLFLVMYHTNKVIGQFNDGQERPYLAVIAGNTKGARTLRNFAEIYPRSHWAWSSRGAMMAVPLLDLQAQPVAIPPQATIPPAGTTTTTPPPTIPTTIPAPATTVAANTGTPVQPAVQQAVPPAATSNPAKPAVVQPGAGSGGGGTVPPATYTPPAALTSSDCVHPGNGYAFGRCGNTGGHGNQGNHGNHGNH